LCLGFEDRSVPIGTRRASPLRNAFDAATENVTTFVIEFIPQATPA
jgi:hypothetical protein